ncbi:PRTRC system protein C [Mucilaginibacter ginkgonis]|uniref:PRTRC system protein C n=1 Tax=Mucilaginibacter ginkgonis TaxID=2682091 RepID=A0A6I4HUZ2_9SPHI|nr:PRTRC system protein C [Mucilaginibacter ginkgonis]QQL50000.1 PRTRC system protein C [Mucilaginibacter ginkgonis]
MKVNILKRVFIHKINGQDVRLADPNETFDIGAVQNFYAATYPVLTNAKINGPEIKDDEMQYRFDAVIGTKG